MLCHVPAGVSTEHTEAARYTKKGYAPQPTGSSAPVASHLLATARAKAVDLHPAMAQTSAQSGLLTCGLPYARIGAGGQALVVLDGFRVEHRPAEGLVLQGMAAAYERYVEAGYTVYILERRAGMPIDYRFDDIVSDYRDGVAELATAPPVDETGVFGSDTTTGTTSSSFLPRGPARADRVAGADRVAEDEPRAVDLMGIGAGGMLALALAAERLGEASGAPVFRRLVLTAAAARLSEKGRSAARRWLSAAEQLRWRTVHREMAQLSHPGVASLFYGTVAWLAPSLFGTTDYPWDFYITLREVSEADLRPRLSAVTVPALLIGGARDELYTAREMQETAAGMPEAEARIIPGAGHVVGRTRRRAVDEAILSFLSR